MVVVFFTLSLVQALMHYAGWIAVIGGVIACLVGNVGRGSELLIGGIGLLVGKHVLGFLVLGATHLLVGERERNIGSGPIEPR